MPNLLGCSLESGHVEPHLAFGESQGAQDDEWWLRWVPGGLRELVKVPMCPATEPPESEHGILCMLPARHWGAHTFDLVAPQGETADSGGAAPPS